MKSGNFIITTLMLSIWSLCLLLRCLYNNRWCDRRIYTWNCFSRNWKLRRDMEPEWFDVLSGKKFTRRRRNSRKISWRWVWRNVICWRGQCRGWMRRYYKYFSSVRCDLCRKNSWNQESIRTYTWTNRPIWLIVHRWRWHDRWIRIEGNRWSRSLNRRQHCRCPRKNWRGIFNWSLWRSYWCSNLNIGIRRCNFSWRRRIIFYKIYVR